MFNCNEYRVWFRHVRDGNEELEWMADRFSRPKTDITFCTIALDGEVIGEGIAACDDVDHFSYAEGRKRSLAQALSDAKFPKELRTEFWSAYFECIGVDFEAISYEVAKKDVVRIFRDMRLLGAWSPERWKADTAEGAAEIFIRCLTCDYTDDEINIIKGLLKGDAA